MDVVSGCKQTKQSQNTNTSNHRQTRTTNTGAAQYNTQHKRTTNTSTAQQHNHKTTHTLQAHNKHRHCTTKQLQDKTHYKAINGATKQTQTMQHNAADSLTQDNQWRNTTNTDNAMQHTALTNHTALTQTTNGTIHKQRRTP